MCFVVVSAWIAWKQGFYRYPLPIAGYSAVIRGWDVFGAFFVFLFTILFVVPLIAFLWFWWQEIPFDFQSMTLEPFTQGWLNVLGVILSAGAVFVFTSYRKPEVKRALLGAAVFQGRKRCLHDMFIGAMTWLLAYPWMIIIGQVTAIFVILLLQQEPSHYDQVAVKFFKTTLSYPLLFIITIILLIVVIPMMEEILFRGFVQTWLKGKWGRMRAIVVTSMIFSAFHFSVSQGLNNIELLISLFVLSCFLGFLYERQQSLLASITLHATFNAVSILAILE